MESIWIKKPENLINNYTNYSIYNDGNKFNTIVRLLIITGFIFMIFKRHNWSYICFVLIIMITIVGYKYDDYKIEQDVIEKEIEYKSCRRSTIDNPMSNLMPYDSQEELEACDEDSEIIKKNLFDEFYEDQNNLNSKTKLRSFITMPVTSILGKREEFLKYTYDSGITCKYDGIACEKHRDVRYSF